MDLALVLLIAAAVAGGVLGAVIRAWSIHSKLYSLEDRLLVVEGVTQREVKIRAGQERWKRPKVEDELLLSQLKLAGATAPATRLNWWENPSLKKGAHVP